MGSLGWPRAAVLLEAASPSSLTPCDSVGAQVWSLARNPPKAACGVSLDSINASACPLLQDNAARAACTGTGIGTGTSPGQVVPGARCLAGNCGYFCSALPSHGIKLALPIVMALRSNTQLGFPSASKSHGAQGARMHPPCLQRSAWDQEQTPLSQQHRTLHVPMGGLGRCAALTSCLQLPLPPPRVLQVSPGSVPCWRGDGKSVPSPGHCSPAPTPQPPGRVHQAPAH